MFDLLGPLSPHDPETVFILSGRGPSSWRVDDVLPNSGYEGPGTTPIRRHRGTVADVTAAELIRLLVRRWYVVVFGVALTVGATAQLLERPPVHFTQFEVVVLPPLEPMSPNTLRQDAYGMVPMAGLMVEEYNQGRHPLNMSTTETTLYGEGLRRGHRVRMRNIGNQWEPVYQDPVIDVQIVDPHRDRVASEAARIVAELNAILERRQDELGVRPVSRMSTRAAPVHPSIQEVGGSRTRTVGGLALLGGAFTLLAVIWAERLSFSRQARGARRPRPAREAATTG